MLARLCTCAGDSHGHGRNVDKLDTLCGRGEVPWGVARMATVEANVEK
jgi:hypothetical protein